MTRTTRRWIRAVAVAVISANIALLYAAQPAHAALTCPPTTISCQLSGTCFFNQMQRVSVCNGVCATFGGTCHANPNLPVQCEALQCSSTMDELFCHCSP
jgi:hypothetical protein